MPATAPLGVVVGALGLVAADKTERCRNNKSNCNYPNITFTSVSDTHVYCVENQPLLSWQTCTGRMLQLFDVQKLHVTSTCTSTEIGIASDDTWLVDLIRFNKPVSIEQRAIDALDKEKLFALDSLFSLYDSLFSHGKDKLVNLSPFGTSCVALKSGNCSKEKVNIKWQRSGPLEGAEMRVWMGPVLVLLGAVLFMYADLLAESTFFHYASWTSGFMIFSIILLLWLLSSRTGRVGKYITYAAGVSSIVGAYVWDMVKIELGKHWPCAPPIHTPHAGLARAYDESMHGESRAAPPASRLRYILAYFLVFGCAGLAYEFWRLKGGRPPMYECSLVAYMIKLASLVLLYFGPFSISLSLTLSLGAVLYPAASVLLSPLQPLWQHLTARRPERAPSWYRPPTASGRYLTEEQYETQGRIATDQGLQSLFKSPEYQAWLLANHQRMSLDGGMRQPQFSPEDDVDD